jgi:hypothetical protein
LWLIIYLSSLNMDPIPPKFIEPTANQLASLIRCWSGYSILMRIHGAMRLLLWRCLFGKAEQGGGCTFQTKEISYYTCSRILSPCREVGYF